MIRRYIVLTERIHNHLDYEAPKIYKSYPQPMDIIQKHHQCAVYFSLEDVEQGADQFQSSKIANSSDLYVSYIIKTDDDTREYLSVYWRDRERHQTHQLTIPEKRFYVFDRDNTLIDDENSLINKNVIVPFLRAVDQGSNTVWAIASATELKADPAYQALKKENSLFGESAYVQFNGMQTLIKMTTKIKSYFLDLKNNEDKLFTLHNTPKIIMDAIINANITAAKKNRKLDFLSMEFSIPQMKSTFNLFSTTSELHFTFGKIKVVMNASKFCAQFELINKGQYKLFSVFAALDQKRCAPKLTWELKAFGIKSIKAPTEYQLIHPKEVVFVDDHVDSCALLEAAGFTAIPTDTKLEKSLPEEEKKYYQSLRVERIKEKINLAIVGKKKTEMDIKNIERESPNENSYLRWMNENIQGTRGLTRFSHWYHGDSGKNRAKQLLKVANDPKSDLDTIVKQLKQAFSESSNSVHSLSRYLTASFGEMELNELQKASDSTFKDYKANFKIEFK